MIRVWKPSKPPNTASGSKNSGTTRRKPPSKPRPDARKPAGKPFDDIKPVEDPVSETRAHIEAGHHVYSTTRGNMPMLLPADGDKNTQQTDTKQAHTILDDHKEQQ